MPLGNAMAAEAREDCLEELDTKLLAIMEAERKLRDRLASVPVDGSEAFEIRTLHLRLEMLADRIMRQKEQFEQNTLALEPPSNPALLDMHKRVSAIRDMNVENETARGIATAIVAVAGELPPLPT